MSKRRSDVEDLRGASRLAVEATKGIVSLVEAMHRTIGGGPELLGRPLEGPTRALTGPIYGGIRAVTDLVGSGIDAALVPLTPLLREGQPGAEREAVLAALNGVLGDYLVATKNPLAIEMRLRHGGEPLALGPEALRVALPDAGTRLLVLVHGSCMSDLQWSRRGHDHGAALARDLGLTPVYVHYNSGLHISSNGRALDAALEALASAWPGRLDEIVLLGHSMGGLVARSACHHGELSGHAWRRALRKLVCLGSPHHGAPLERGGNLLEVLLRASRYSAPLASLGQIRSAGVTDMRFGNVVDADWEGRDRFERTDDRRTPLPLPEEVACFAIAATTGTEPLAALPSDGLVPVDSALGRCARSELTLAFPEAHRWIALGAGHLDLLDRAEVYEKLRAWLA